MEQLGLKLYVSNRTGNFQAMKMVMSPPTIGISTRKGGLKMGLASGRGFINKERDFISQSSWMNVIRMTSL